MGCNSQWYQDSAVIEVASDDVRERSLLFLHVCSHHKSACAIDRGISGIRTFDCAGTLIRANGYGQSHDSDHERDCAGLNGILVSRPAEWGCLVVDADCSRTA